jgi:hypothetical protein
MRLLYVTYTYNNIIIILKPDVSISSSIGKFESKYYKKDAVVKYIFSVLNVIFALFI